SAAGCRRSCRPRGCRSYCSRAFCLCPITLIHSTPHSYKSAEVAQVVRAQDSYPSAAGPGFNSPSRYRQPDCSRAFFLCPITLIHSTTHSYKSAEVAQVVRAEYSYPAADGRGISAAWGRGEPAVRGLFLCTKTITHTILHSLK